MLYATVIGPTHKSFRRVVIAEWNTLFRKYVVVVPLKGMKSIMLPGSSF
jgi:hypothetical protein